MAHKGIPESLTGQQDNLTIGVDNQRQIDETVAVTRKAIRQLLVFVGGTGLETLAAMNQILKEHNIRFGDESLAATRSIVPYAIFVDSDVMATRSVQNTGDEGEVDERQKKYQLQLQELQDRGVRVCTIFNKGRSEFVTASGLSDVLTPGLPGDEDPRGSKADPRVGIVRYFSVRNRLDDTNPREEARKAVSSWLQTGHAFLAEQTLLTVVGGLHGGTGQMALPIMADVRNEIDKVLLGSRTTLMTERYAMTAQSAGLDASLANDGLQAKRKLNTVAGVILANAAAVKRGMEMMPGEWIPGVPSQLTFLVNGANPHKQAGDHYAPTKLIAKLLATRILGLDMTSVGRSQAGVDIRESGTSRTSNEPRAVFSALGVSELLPEPERAQLTMQKKRKVFSATVGIGESNLQVATEQVRLLLPANCVSAWVNDVEAPQLLATQFGEGEEAKSNIETECARFTGDLNTKLRAEVRRTITEKTREFDKSFKDSVAQLKRTHGLATVHAFVAGITEQLGQLRLACSQTLTTDCSQEALEAKHEQSTKLVERVQRMNIPKMNLFIGRRDKALSKLNDLLNDVASSYTEYAKLFGNSLFLKDFNRYFIDPLSQVAVNLKENLTTETAAANTLIAGVKPDPTEMSLKTPFDVPVPVEMQLSEEPLELRGRFLEDQEWTEENMQRLMDSLRVTASDMRLFTRLNGPVLEALGKLSAPLTRPTTASSVHGATTVISTTSVPVNDRREAANVPVPEESRSLPVGPDGPYMVIQEQHGINALLDDAYVRECLELLLATPPTQEEAQILRSTHPSDSELRLMLNRESQFVLKGQAERLLPAVFKALAERKFNDAGRKGEIMECAGDHCGMVFYRAPEERKVLCCPGCRRLPNAPVAVQSRAPKKTVAAPVVKKGGSKKK